MQCKHRSQFQYDGENAHTGPLRFTPDDIACIKTLHPEVYPYLPAPWWHALVCPEKNYTRFAKRAGTLARWWRRARDEPLQPPYIKRHQVPLKHALYSRTEAGDVLVNEVYPLRTTHNQAHETLQALVHASIDIGVRQADGFRLVHWPEIRDIGWSEFGTRKYVHDRTLDLPDPHTIPLTQEDERGRLVAAGRSRADGSPFLLKHRTGGQLFFLGKEIDRSTEPLETSHASRRNIKQKLLHYKHIFERAAYREHYGFPNSMVLFVFINENRLNSTLRLAASVFGKPCPYIAYYHWRDWYNERSFPEPTGHIFTAAGKRLGRHEFKLCEFWNS